MERETDGEVGGDGGIGETMACENLSKASLFKAALAHY